MGRPKGSGLIPVATRLKTKTIIGDGGCWLWMGSKSHNGYGYINTEAGVKRVHRVSFEMHKGAVPKGVFVLHKCDVRNCWNPDHLFLGTASDNTADMMEKSRNVPAPRRGMDNATSLVTDDIVRAIRADHRRIVDIAKDYGIHFTTVSDIRRRKSWRHIE